MGDFNDAIAILREVRLKAEALFMTYDDSDAMHLMNGLSKAIDILENSKMSDIVSEEIAVQRAIDNAREVGGDTPIWNGTGFEEV